MLSDNNRNEHRKGQGGLEPAGALRTSIRDAREGEKERERGRAELSLLSLRSLCSLLSLLSSLSLLSLLSLLGLLSLLSVLSFSLLMRASDEQHTHCPQVPRARHL